MKYVFTLTYKYNSITVTRLYFERREIQMGYRMQFYSSARSIL